MTCPHCGSRNLRGNVPAQKIECADCRESWDVNDTGKRIKEKTDGKQEQR